MPTANTHNNEVRPIINQKNLKGSVLTFDRNSGSFHRHAAPQPHRRHYRIRFVAILQFRFSPIFSPRFDKLDV
jgi:hypothetical protein